jgi:hypothetical protein
VDGYAPANAEIELWKDPGTGEAEFLSPDHQTGRLVRESAVVHDDPATFQRVATCPRSAGRVG